jgi:hypothetical protein
MRNTTAGMYQPNSVGDEDKDAADRSASPRQQGQCYSALRPRPAVCPSGFPSAAVVNISGVSANADTRA